MLLWHNAAVRKTPVKTALSLAPALYNSSLKSPRFDLAPRCIRQRRRDGKRIPQFPLAKVQGQSFRVSYFCQRPALNSATIARRRIRRLCFCAGRSRKEEARLATRRCLAGISRDLALPMLMFACGIGAKWSFFDRQTKKSAAGE